MQNEDDLEAFETEQVFRDSLADAHDDLDGRGWMSMLDLLAWHGDQAENAPDARSRDFHREAVDNLELSLAAGMLPSGIEGLRRAEAEHQADRSRWPDHPTGATFAAGEIARLAALCDRLRTENTELRRVLGNLAGFQPEYGNEDDEALFEEARALLVEGAKP